jgi:hypothetical protein
MRLFPTTLLICLVGCAASPPPANHAAQPAAKPQQTAAVATATTTSAAQSTNEFRPPAGFKTRKKGGETLYCRTDTHLGSRFPAEQCFTQQQVKEMEIANQATRDNFSEHSRICAGGSCGNE